MMSLTTRSELVLLSEFYAHLLSFNPHVEQRNAGLHLEGASANLAAKNEMNSGNKNYNNNAYRGNKTHTEEEKEATQIPMVVAITTTTKVATISHATTTTTTGATISRSILEEVVPHVRYAVNLVIWHSNVIIGLIMRTSCGEATCCGLCFCSLLWH